MVYDWIVHSSVRKSLHIHAKFGGFDAQTATWGAFKALIRSRSKFYFVGQGKEGKRR